MPDHKMAIIETILFALFAGIGGALSYLMRTLNMNVKPSFSRAIVEAMSSAFVGLIAMLACKGLSIDWYWSGVIVGVFGWMGAEASMVVFTKLVKSRLGFNKSCDK